MKDNLYYLGGLALILLGFSLPPLGGYESIPTIIGTLIMTKRFMDNTKSV